LQRDPRLPADGQGTGAQGSERAAKPSVAGKYYPLSRPLGHTEGIEERGHLYPQNDRYQREDDVPDSVPGNPWFISMLWLGEYLVARARNLEELHEALPCLEWCAKNALPSGVLAEQVHPVRGYPLSVSPLTWSHAAYVWVVLQYVEKFDSLRKDAADPPPPCP
jgi:hypothetical protein